MQYLSFDVPAFFRLVSSRRPDVLIVEPPPTTGFTMRLATAIIRLPYVYYAADIWSIAAAATGAASLVLRIVDGMERSALGGARDVLAVSDGVRDEVKRLAPSASVTVVGHGVDMSIFNPEVVPFEDDVDAVYVGTASEWHGAGVLLEGLRLAASRGLTIRAAFVGTGSEIGVLRDRVREWGMQDHVTFHAPVAASQAARWLRSARFALASLRPGIGYDFAVPTKIYSALAVGTPVLYAGPEHIGAVIRDNRLGWGCAYSPEGVADALASACVTVPGDGARERRAAWVRDNVSAESVARRAAIAVEAAARRS